MINSEYIFLQGHALVCGVPDHLIDGLLNYIIHGVPTGGFLTAVLENNLMEAFGRADIESALGLRHVCAFLYNHAPAGCYGNPMRVEAWIQMHADRREAAAKATTP